MPLLLFLILPLAEIAGFIVVGQAIGLVPTLLLTIAISALGLTMMRDAGALTLAGLQRGARAPGNVLAEGGIRMAAGLLFLIPGFLTDIAGVALLTFGAGRLLMAGKAPPSAPPAGPNPPRNVIEGDFRRLDH